MSTVDIDKWAWAFVMEVGCEYATNKPRHASRYDELKAEFEQRLAANTTTLKAELLAKKPKYQKPYRTGLDPDSQFYKGVAFGYNQGIIDFTKLLEEL